MLALEDTKVLLNCSLIIQKEILISTQKMSSNQLDLCGLAKGDTQMSSDCFSSTQTLEASKSQRSMASIKVMFLKKSLT